MSYTTKRTSELQVGDVVACHGMRCLVDTELSTRGVRDGVYFTRALVLNRDDVSDGVVPRSWTAELNGEHRWTIQGNDLARWSVERRPCGCASDAEHETKAAYDIVGGGNPHTLGH